MGQALGAAAHRGYYYPDFYGFRLSQSIIRMSRKAAAAASSSSEISQFYDLQKLPLELSWGILSNLNATDLCLAACVWGDLANDNLLWQALCYRNWKSTTKILSSPEVKTRKGGSFFKSLYLLLDEATLTFNADPFLGYSLMTREGLVEPENPHSMAQFLHGTNRISIASRQLFFSRHHSFLLAFLQGMSFRKQFLPNSLRLFFAEVLSPASPTELASLVDVFANKFCKDNDDIPGTMSQEIIVLLCFALVMLSADMYNPRNRMKMSKREFIKNVSNAAEGEVSQELVGHLYDNIYLVGHVIKYRDDPL